MPILGMKSDSPTSRDRRGNTVMMAFWHLLKAFAEPPEDKPDLWVVRQRMFRGSRIWYLLLVVYVEARAEERIA
jgi:hypothetical protein